VNGRVHPMAFSQGCGGVHIARLAATYCLDYLPLTRKMGSEIERATTIMVRGNTGNGEAAMRPSAEWIRARCPVVSVMSARRSRADEVESEVLRAFRARRAQVPHNMIRTIQCEVRRKM